MTKHKLSAVKQLTRANSYILITDKEAIIHEEFKGAAKSIIVSTIKHFITVLREQLAELGEEPKKKKHD